MLGSVRLRKCKKSEEIQKAQKQEKNKLLLNNSYTKRQLTNKFCLHILIIQIPTNSMLRMLMFDKTGFNINVPFNKSHNTSVKMHPDPYKREVFAG